MKGLIVSTIKNNFFVFSLLTKFDKQKTRPDRMFSQSQIRVLRYHMHDCLSARMTQEFDSLSKNPLHYTRSTHNVSKVNVCIKFSHCLTPNATFVHSLCSIAVKS